VYHLNYCSSEWSNLNQMPSKCHCNHWSEMSVADLLYWPWSVILALICYTGGSVILDGWFVCLWVISSSRQDVPLTHWSVSPLLKLSMDDQVLCVWNLVIKVLLVYCCTCRGFPTFQRWLKGSNIEFVQMTLDAHEGWSVCLVAWTFLTD